MYTASQESTQSTKRIEFTTRPSEIPGQQGSLPFQPTSREFPLTSAIHDVNCLADGYFAHWNTMDKLYYDLENIQALQINLRLLIPVDLIHSRQKTIKEIVHRLPLLRSRNNSSLTFTVEGELVPWET